MPRSKLLLDVSATRDIPLGTLVTGTVLGLLTLLLVSGCAEKSAVQAEDREVPLTTGDSNNVRPYFSPDGKYVLFTALEGPGGLSGTKIEMVPADGGEARVIDDSPHQIGRGWDPVKKTLLVWNGMEQEVRWVDEDGSVRDAIKVPDMTYLQDVSRDGELMFGQFVGDNYDLGVRNKDGNIEFFRATPAWEIQGCYGPKPGDITIVRQAGYRAQTSEILIRSEGGAETQLPLVEAKLRFPAWSPDRRYMAYVSDRSGNMDLWVYDEGTRRTIQLTSTPEDESSPAWSPDGEWLAFSRSKQTSNLYLGDPDTFERTQLTKTESKDTNPWVSPDGTKVAFYRRAIKEKAGKLCIASLPDGEVKEYSYPNLTMTLEEWPIAWSAKSNAVAIPADDGSGNVDIYRISLEDGRASRVTISPGVDTNPCWSPDGNTIAYIRLVEGGIQIWTIPATGGTPRQISQTPGMNVLPRWSFDSRQLAWASEKQGVGDEEGDVELWVAPVENPRDAWMVDARLPEGRGCYPLYWSRDDRKLFVQRRVDDGINFYSVSLDGSGAALAATVGKGDKDDFLEFTKRGEIYKDQCFPGGMHVFADGEEVSNIYKIRVPEIVAAWLQADGGLN